MNVSQSKISGEAFKFIKKNKKLLIQKFAELENYPPSEKPFTIFMAGSPGAGKTEFSKSFNPDLYQFTKDQKTKFVRIDADEIRHLIPQFSGKNSSEIQRAASKGVFILFDHVQHSSQNAIVDGTFANFKISYDNVKRALGRNRSVGIFYLYQGPKTAWEFTKKRDKVEGRNISKKVFINAFFKAKENVNKIKKIFKDKIVLDLIIKNFENKVASYHINISRVDGYLKKEYNTGQLRSLLK